MRQYILLLILVSIGTVFAACDDGGDGDADVDVDGDVDTDGDIDGDVDTDGDVDADGDADGDEDVEPLPPAQPSSHVQSAGGGRTLSDTYDIQIRMGAPQPVGTTTGERYQIQLGPASAPR